MADSSSFMEEVQIYPCLYDKTCKEFKNKNVKFNAWSKIALKFNITPDEAEKKYKNIRTSYGRYVKRMKTIPSGSGRNAVPKEFVNLDWLQGHISVRQSTTTNFDAGKKSSF